MVGAGGTPTPQEFNCFLTYNLNAEQLKWLKKNGIDAHDVKSDAPGKVSNFDIYVDREKKLWRVRKGQNQNQGEYLGNLKDFQ